MRLPPKYRFTPERNKDLLWHLMDSKKLLCFRTSSYFVAAVFLHSVLCDERVTACPNPKEHPQIGQGQMGPDHRAPPPNQ